VSERSARPVVAPATASVRLPDRVADLAPPPHATAGRRWRFRRDLVIYLAHRRNGLSQRFLADVFDLPRSRIAAILAKFDAHTLPPESDR
jgi:hypothetical protein